MKKLVLVCCLSLFCLGMTTDHTRLGSADAFTIEQAFKTPKGYERIPLEESSFGWFLRHFKLKSPGSKVYYYNGKERHNEGLYSGVLDLDVGDKDLQQCADAVIRLRAEYLYQSNQFDKIAFNFTNGFRADFTTWAKGNRIKVIGNKATWEKGGKAGLSRQIFMEYLETVFSYAGTISLQKELTPVSLAAIQPGDVFIQGGSPGHAVIVMDVAQNPKDGSRLFIIAQSFMPAQSMHVIANQYMTNISPWFDLREGEKLNFEDWPYFSSKDLRRFR